MSKSILNTPVDLRSFFLFPFFLMLILGLTFPSDGGHGLLNIKSLAFILSSLSAMVYLLIAHRSSLSQLKLFLCTAGYIAFLLIWAFLSFIGNETPSSSISDQFKLFFLTFSVAAMAFLYFHEELLSYRTFVQTIIYANFSYSLAKISLVILHFLKVVNLWDILDFIGLRYMKMSILGDLSRFQTSVDIVTPFFLFFALQLPFFSKKFKVIYTILSFISIFLSFSRFLFFIACLSLFFYLTTLKVADFLKGLSVLVVSSFLLFLWIGPENVSQMIEIRFLSAVNKASDTTRQEQIEALLSDFEMSPVIGKGLGSYSENEIRDPLNPHSYEVQWVAFLMQFGVVGLFILFLFLSFIAFLFFTPSFSRVHFSILLLFLFWLVSGLTNPFLISLTSGIMYSLFILTGLQLRKSRV